MSGVHPLRVRPLNAAPVRADGAHVVYWCVAARRMRRNFALQHAVATARELGRPLLVLEALRCGHRYATPRTHRFVIEGMRANARALEGAGVGYHPYVEPRDGDGRGLLAALAAQACCVVTDDFPHYFIPRMQERAAQQVRVRMEAVDGNGILPLRAADRAFPTAHGFRRHLQRVLPDWLDDVPAAVPVTPGVLPACGEMPPAITARWPRADLDALLAPGGLDALALDVRVTPVDVEGGADAGGRVLQRFVDERLAGYGTDRNHPDRDATSGLSPYLHFGHVSAHDALLAVADAEGWSPVAVVDKPVNGSRTGWWGMSEPAEAFLDQLVTWREVGLNMCAHGATPDAYGSLPDWALTTLEEHAGDRRERLYDLDDLTAARTDDPLWNAAQRQLVSEGRIHNYLRMLWGKRVLAWTEHPRRALDVLLELNDRYALDGRDPNSLSGVFWVFGRYDRAWGPERPIFGKIRYMTSSSAARKLRLRGYLERFSGEDGA